MSKITLSEKDFKSFYKKLSTNQLANLLGVSRMCIWRKAKQLGLSKRKTKLS